MSCDHSIGSNRSIEDIQPAQSVSLPILTGMYAADYCLSPKRDNLKKGKCSQDNQNNHKIDANNKNNNHNNNNMNNMPTSYPFTTNSLSHDIAMGIPQNLMKPIHFGDISTNQSKYRSSSSNQQEFNPNFPLPPTNLHKIENDNYVIINDEEDDKDAIPIPISWIGKPELYYNRRTSATSTTSTGSGVSTISATTFSYNDENHEIEHNLHDDLEGTSIVEIPLRPLSHDLTQLHDDPESIGNAQESYESESESDHDDNAPTPKAGSFPTLPIKDAHLPQPGFTPIGSHDCNCGCNDDVDHEYGIGARKQSTQKLLKIQITATTCEHHDGDVASTCDYDDSLPNASPQLRGSPSSLDELPPLPGAEMLSQSNEIICNFQHDHDTNNNKYFDDEHNLQTEEERAINIIEINDIKNLLSHYEQKEDDNFNQHTLIETIDIQDIDIETKYNEHDIDIATTIKPQVQQQDIITSYEEYVDKNLISYDWQKQIENEQNYGAYFPNFQKEIMKNPFFKLTAGDFNDVLKKCQFIRSRWLGEKIRSTRPGSFGKAKWKSGEKITELDLFAIKLYTDFESCQRELKKCYRPPSTINELEMQQYESRLCHFSHWRRLLNTAILKYGVLLRNRVFYHGINKIMKLNIHPTHQCHGPFSATSDIEIARGFATKNGFIMKMCSKYPRLGTDYFFDAAAISAYPDEKEYLIGFMYTRILHIQLGCTKMNITDLTKEQLSKLTCFIISSLVKHHLYSYGQYLTQLFKALLITDPKYSDDEELERLSYHIVDNKQREREMKNIREIGEQIPQFIQKEFIKRRNNQRVLKLDKVSHDMQSVFYDNSNTSQVSMSRIYKYSPNIKELHLYEEYEITNNFIDNFMSFLQFYKPSNIKLDTVKVFKYSFNGSSEQFQFKNCISMHNQCKLDDMGWNIKEYRDANCYKFILKKKK